MGLAIAALAQLLSMLLAGAGHGWVSPFFASLALWALVPATLVITRPTAGNNRMLLLLLAAAALAADAWLVMATIGEHNALTHYVDVNGVVGLSIILLWLCLWGFWQAMLFRSLVAGRIPVDANG